MKKIATLLTIGLLGSMIGFGCVEENPTVQLVSVSNDKEAKSGEDFEIWGGVTCEMSPDMLNHALYAVFKNNALDQPVWSGSGGGGTGSTFEPQPPNRNTIYIDSLEFVCDSVDGKKENCKNAEKISLAAKLPVAAGGSGKVAFPLPYEQIKSWGAAEEAVVKIYAKYHDVGILHGTTSSLNMSFGFAEMCEPGSQPLWTEEELEEEKKKQEEEQQKQEGGNSQPNPGPDPEKPDPEKPEK